MTSLPNTADSDGAATSRRLQVAPATPAELTRVDVSAAERAAAELLVALGADLELEGLRDTPRRMAAAYAELLTPVQLRSPRRCTASCATTRAPARSSSA